MKTRLLRRASAGALALTLIGATAAMADGILADADALVADTPHGNGETASQQAGTTVDYDFSAMIDQDKNASNDVFPGSLVVTAKRGGAWVTSTASADTTMTFSGYAQPQAGKISITVPCAATEATTMTVALTAAASSNGKSLSSSKDSATLNYRITPTSPAASSCTAPTDNPPVVTITTVDPTGGEGSAVALGATASDDKGTPGLEWSAVAKSGVDTGASCSFGDPKIANTTITCTDDGVYTVTLTATDSANQTASDSVDLTLDNVNPVLGTASFGASNLSCGTDNASVEVPFTDAGTNDTHDVALDWDNDGTYDETVTDVSSGVKVPHTYGAGVHTVGVKVVDDDGGFDETVATAVVNYNLSGILQPINTTGSRSLFKYGSTIPVKVRILECDGSPALGLVPTLKVQQYADGTPSGVDEAVGSTSSADSGTNLRYSGADGIYIYNLATKTLADPTAGYQATVTIPTTGQSVDATFGLKK